MVQFKDFCSPHYQQLLLQLAQLQPPFLLRPRVSIVLFSRKEQKLQFQLHGSISAAGGCYCRKFFGSVLQSLLNSCIELCSSSCIELCSCSRGFGLSRLPHLPLMGSSFVSFTAAGEAKPALQAPAPAVPAGQGQGQPGSVPAQPAGAQPQGAQPEPPSQPEAPGDSAAPPEAQPSKSPAQSPAQAPGLSPAPGPMQPPPPGQAQAQHPAQVQIPTRQPSPMWPHAPIQIPARLQQSQPQVHTSGSILASTQSLNQVPVQCPAHLQLPLQQPPRGIIAVPQLQQQVQVLSELQPRVVAQMQAQQGSVPQIKLQVPLDVQQSSPAQAQHIGSVVTVQAASVQEQLHRVQQLREQQQKKKQQQIEIKHEHTLQASNQSDIIQKQVKLTKGN